ncbi:MAG: BON domain-containing protein [Rhodospirillales bacterium]
MLAHIRLKTLLAAFVLLASLGACDAISGRETAGEYIDDATITARVKTSIISELGLKQINVESLQDVVQLSGFVDSPLVKARAGEIARGTKGVKSVQNDLVVR